jgi:hypothetical protein
VPSELGAGLDATVILIIYLPTLPLMLFRLPTADVIGSRVINLEGTLSEILPRIQPPKTLRIFPIL